MEPLFNPQPGISPNHFQETFHGEQKVTPQFTSAEEELSFLRAELAKKETALAGTHLETNKEDLAKNLIENYKKTPIEQVVHPSAIVSVEQQEGIALKLKPETHDNVMAELVTTLMEKGIRNTLELVRKMNSPHIDDDFHRFLVQYLAEYHAIPGLKNDSETFKNLDISVFEVMFPVPEEGKTYKETIQLMEQFYASMQAVGPGNNEKKNYFALEIALSNENEQVIFYVSVPNSVASLFEKQVIGLFKNAQVTPITNDYNIFNPNGFSAGSYALPSNTDVLTLKTYDVFDHDPMDLMIGIFEKLKREGEGASVQLIVRPVGDKFTKEYGKVLDWLRKGETMKKVKESMSGDLLPQLKNWGSALWNVVGDGEEKKKEEKKDGTKIVDEVAIKNATKKLESTITETTIRIIASAETQVRADEILRDLQSAFFQYEEAQSNGVKFVQVKGSDLSLLFRDFSYRRFDSSRVFHLNFKELATMFHFPTHNEGSAQLKQAGAATHPAPMEIGTSGVLLGYNNHRGRSTPIYMNQADRLRHFYTIGQTGVGKTQMFLKMIIQDIKNGEGCCYIDPHGTDVQTILANIPPERFEDVIYFDPAYTARPMGLNMLEYDITRPDQKSLVLSELLGIFDKLFDMKSQGGPMFGQYFRNAALLLFEDTSKMSTLMDITRVLSDKQFRDEKLALCRNPLIVQFWKTAEQTSGESGLENFVPYISSKFDQFLSNEIMRPVVLQARSVFNFRDIMDNKKILLVNLSKGLLGKENANLIGLILVGKLQMAAMSRADSHDLSKFPPFYVYLDEFQNVVTDSISEILSEARKYKLSLIMTHQYLEQLPEFIRSAVFGNVGNMAFFRIKSEDAATVEPRIAPRFKKEDIIKLENFNCVVSMLVDGKPVPAFNMDTFNPDGFVPRGNEEQINQLKQLSYMKYGRDRAEVEQEIIDQFQNSTVTNG
jgi:hypothetical protein